MKIEQAPGGYWHEIYQLEGQIYARAEKTKAFILEYNATDQWTLPALPGTEPGLENEVTFALWKARRGLGLSFGSVAVNQIIRPDSSLIPDAASVMPAIQTIYGYTTTSWLSGWPGLRVHKTGIQDIYTDTGEDMLARYQGWKQASKMKQLRPTKEDYELFKFVMEIGATGESRY
ncbi:MAG TPA: hypothetical protein VLG11_00375 [Candidatus Saccharimonadales bacterium]|nr:hypothetical protein [Candidatus Saccharimonadales bacterium]